MIRLSMPHTFLTLCCLLVLSGCQSITGPTPSTADCEPLTGWLKTLPPWPGNTLRTTQLAEFHDRHNDSLYILRYDITISSEALVMSAQTTLGLPLYDSVLSNGCLKVQRHISQLEGLPAAQAVSDFILASWPLSELSSALANDGYTLQQNANERTLFGSNGEPLVTAILPASEVSDILQILHHDVPLEITIQNLDRTVDQR